MKLLKTWRNIVKLWRNILPAVSIAALLLLILSLVYSVGYASGHSAGVHRIFEIWEVDSNKPYIFRNIEEDK